MTRDLERFGIQELTELEQREVHGGGFWEKVGHLAGAAVGTAVTMIVDFAGYVAGYEYSNARYNGTWQG